MSIYEFVARSYLRYTRGEAATQLGADSLSSREAAFVGFGSGCISSVITNPLDCVNTRIKSGEFADIGLLKAHSEIVRQDGITALFRGVLPRTLMIGAGSTVFWYFFAVFKEVLSPQ